MRRVSRFRRDFEDIHGREAWADVDIEIIRHEDVRAGRIVTGMDHPGLRLTVGALGLFWAIVLVVVMAVFVVVAWAMISSLGAPSLPS